MRVSLRLIVSLVVAVTLVSFAFAVYQVQAESKSKRAELAGRARILAESLREAIELLPPGSDQRLHQIVEKFGSSELLAGIVIYSPEGRPVITTSDLSHRLEALPPLDPDVLMDKPAGRFVNPGTAELYVYAVPLHTRDQISGALALFHDASYIEANQLKMWRDIFARVVVQMLVIVAITLLVIRWTMVRPILRTAQWIRDLRAGRAARHGPSNDAVLEPLTLELTHLATSLRQARASAEAEARLREAGESLWTEERLRVFMRTVLDGRHLFVVSNREPYSHYRRGNTIETLVPASGLVTAMEPVLCASDGTWVAHGSGDADSSTTDEHDRLRVPPDEPKYTLRRVWLSREEEEGYYYGFANEGLWPLCHIAHTRPIFRAEDWRYYQDVNRKFADTVLEEAAGTEDPVILVQDYHFALLPAHDQGSPARRTGSDILAHPVAEPGGLRDLPLAAGTARRPAGRGSDRLSHSVALPELSRDGGPRF